MTPNPHSIDAVFAQAGLPRGRYWGSKSGYRATHPGARFIANAWVYLRHGNRVWGGDLDLATSDMEALKRVSRRLNRKLYVLREQPSHRALSAAELEDWAEVAIWRQRVRYGSAVR